MEDTSDGNDKQQAKVPPPPIDLTKDSSKSGSGKFWTTSRKNTLVQIVNEKRAHLPRPKHTGETWDAVAAVFKERTGESFTGRTLQTRYKALLAESVEKDPNNESMFTDEEAELWSTLEDHRLEIAEKEREDTKAAEKKKTKEDALIKQGKEARDNASTAMINGTVARMGGKKWRFDGDKIVATKEDGTEFNIDYADLKDDKKGGNGGRKASIAEALKSMADARQQAEHEKFEMLKLEIESKERAEQRRHDAEVKQREQQFQLQQQQQQIQFMVAYMQMVKSGITLPPGMFPNMVPPTNDNGDNGDNGDDGNNGGPAPKRARHD
jgi:hypothetical protein